jgi:DNA-binding response OmpR family regulator
MPEYSNAILVVEDEAYLSKIIVNRLEEEGYVVQSAADGVQALLMTRAQEFSLILLDLLMPVMDGFDFLRKLREKEVHTPVMVFSNLSHNQQKDDVVRLGANSYYVKTDISVDEIVKKIKNILQD